METTQRRKRYDEWLDLAEDRVADWLQVTATRQETEPADLRALASAVNLLRTIIDIRRKLDDWETHDPKQQAGGAAAPTEEEILALMENCDNGDEDRADEEEVPL